MTIMRCENVTVPSYRYVQSPDPGGTDLPPTDNDREDEDETPDTPPTEPEPIPMRDPPPGPDEDRGPYIA